MISSSQTSDRPSQVAAWFESMPASGLFLVVAVALGVALVTWWQKPEYPTGLDGGNWLAFGRSFAGAGHKSEIAAYPPGVPLALQGLSSVTTPLTALRIVGIGSVVATFFGVSLSSRMLGAPASLAVMGGLLVVLSGPINETYAFGGYPQNYAVSSLTLAVAAAVLYSVTGRWTFQVASAALFVVLALCHHMYFAAGGACLLTTATIQSLSGAPGTRLERTIGLIAIFALGVAAFLPTYLRMHDLGYKAPLNPAAFDPGQSLLYAFRNLRWFWLVLLFSTFAFLCLSWPKHRSPEWIAAVSLGASPVAAFLLTGEPRLIPLLLVAAAITATWMVQQVLTGPRSVPSASLAVPALALILLVAPGMRRQNEAFAVYYEVLNPSLLESIRWVDEHHTSQRVAVASIREGWPVGWWYGGLTSARIAVQSDEKWIAFPAELSDSALVDSLERAGSSSKAAKLAADHNIEFLVLRRAEWQGWRLWLDEPAAEVSLAHEDSEYVIIRFHAGAQS